MGKRKGRGIVEQSESSKKRERKDIAVQRLPVKKNNRYCSL